MDDKLMYIPNDDIQNYTFCRLELAIETFGHLNNEPTNQIQVVELTNKKILS